MATDSSEQAVARLGFSVEFEGSDDESLECSLGLIAGAMPVGLGVRYYGFFHRTLESTRCRRIEFVVFYFGPVDQVQAALNAGNWGLERSLLRDYNLYPERGLSREIFSGSELLDQHVRSRFRMERARFPPPYSWGSAGAGFGAKPSFLAWLESYMGLDDQPQPNALPPRA